MVGLPPPDALLLYPASIPGEPGTTGRVEAMHRILNRLCPHWPEQVIVFDPPHRIRQKKVRGWFTLHAIDNSRFAHPNPNDTMLIPLGEPGSGKPRYHWEIFKQNGSGKPLIKFGYLLKGRTDDIGS